MCCMYIFSIDIFFKYWHYCMISELFDCSYCTTKHVIVVKAISYVYIETFIVYRSVYIIEDLLDIYNTACTIYKT